MVKVQGQNSNWNTVKQTAENGQKFLGDGDAAGNTSLVPGVKNPRLRNGHEFDWMYSVYYSRSPMKWFRQIMNISNRSRDLAWWWGGTTDVTNARMCSFFAICLTFSFEFRPHLHHRVLRNKSIRSEITHKKRTSFLLLLVSRYENTHHSVIRQYQD